MRKNLENLICKLGLVGRVELPGTVNDVIQRISRARLFVLSSDYEGIPNALLEALSVGLPCISTDCEIGGARELIENGVNGIIVPRDNVEAMSKAIEHMLKNPDYSEKLGNKAIEVRDKYNFDKINELWYEFLKKVCENEKS